MSFLLTIGIWLHGGVIGFVCGITVRDRQARRRLEHVRKAREDTEHRKRIRKAETLRRENPSAYRVAYDLDPSQPHPQVHLLDGLDPWGDAL